MNQKIFFVPVVGFLTLTCWKIIGTIGSDGPEKILGFAQAAIYAMLLSGFIGIGLFKAKRNEIAPVKQSAFALSFSISVSILLFCIGVFIIA